MTKETTFKNSLAAASMAIGLGSLALPVLAAKVGDVIAASDQWLVAQVESQKKVDALAEERSDLAERYRTTLRESEGLRLYIRQLNAQLKSQQEEMEVVRAESREIERTSVEILPLMQKMLSTLEQFVQLDMPFLLEDRRTRIAKLNELMPRADVTVSEKYRKIVEAYQLEMEYGRTIEAYRAQLEGKTVDFLRVGRVALLYQTPDGGETGYWDTSAKAWVKDDDYEAGVREGLLIAKKQATPDLLVVPVAAAQQKGK